MRALDSFVAPYPYCRSIRGNVDRRASVPESAMVARRSLGAELQIGSPMTQTPSRSASTSWAPTSTAWVNGPGLSYCGLVDQPTSPAEMWDTRYAGADDYLFGDQPNDYLKAQAHLIPPGSDVLCLADGEGRNGVFLAEMGHRVTSVDLSSVALAKASALADQRGVKLATVVADLGTFDLGENTWDAIVSVFAHMPATVRGGVHAQAAKALRPNGWFILEAYQPDQADRDTGGPSRRSFLATADELVNELQGLNIVHRNEAERAVVEGPAHSGMALVVQITAQNSEDEESL